MGAFLATIEGDREALVRLANFLTINVTEFFRDPQQFEVLKTAVLPELLQHRTRLNIWSAGCSTGAEPYTLAILLSEITRGSPHTILATDLDQEALERARAGGPYGPAETRNLGRWMQLKYFDAAPGGLVVKDSLKRMVRFQRHNLLADRFETDFDLILCRNVVIYFSEEVKEALNPRFARSLRDGGWLFIGGAETLLHAQDFGLERLQPCLYRKSAAPAKAPASAATAV